MNDDARIKFENNRTTIDAISAAFDSDTQLYLQKINALQKLKKVHNY
jgi:hypothetical protein